MVFYISHRLHIAGFAGSNLFSHAALRRLYASSGGIPRLVNILAHKSLMAAYGEGRQQVRAAHVRMAAQDTVSVKKASRVWWLLGASTLLVAVIDMAVDYLT